MGLFLHLDRGAKVAATLKIVQEIALALVQEVVVESIFLVDRDFSFQDTVPDVKTLGVEDNDGSRVDQIDEVDGVRFGAIFLLGYGNLSEHTLLFLQFLAQALKRIGDAGGGNAIARVHFGYVLKLAFRKS
jgi:hypothetical protein